MKKLSEYNELINIDEELNNLFNEYGLINEGKLGSILGKIFKWGKNKLSKEIDDFKKYSTITAGTLLSNKDKESKKAAQEFNEEYGKCKDDKERLEVLKTHAESLIKKRINDMEDPHWPLSIKRQLANIGKDLKDDEAIELSKKLQESIDKKWDEKEVKKNESEVEQVENKVKAAADKNDSNKEESSETPEASEEVTDKTEEAIVDNKDILAPLVKKAGINGEDLRDFIAYKLSYNALKDSKSKKDGSQLSRNQKAEDVTEEDVLGMSIVICGAIISGNHKRFNRIIEVIGLCGDDSKVKSAEDLKKLIADRKNWGSGVAKKK